LNQIFVGKFYYFLEGFGTELNIVDNNITHENTTSCNLITIKNNFYSTTLNNLLDRNFAKRTCAPPYIVSLSKDVAKVLDKPPLLIVNEKSPFDQDFNPCKFWKTTQLRFLALLAPIAGNIICIPCSSANIKRLCV
jgi:hypothetical protein